ncbi:MAG: DNA-protecting protein DprA [Candidatus Woesebacteria bacterium]|nr:DNA-protecting protein DprA [Candidatus Woesebacteria bacterium]
MKLYIEGKILQSDCKAIAVVGSRNLSPRGEALTKKFVKKFVKEGYTIISGLARGIDTVAHKTALAMGGRTIAVLGSGLDIIYPFENKALSEEIVKHGALVSPYSNGTKPLPKNFLARNRIIVELSCAVLVVEGKRRSGTLSTASWAANSGIDVFAIPGSEATDWLIEEGANSVKSPKEVIDKLWI